tara:strand:+ start:256 stop:741 length:486 start_codon:yes stop_codon:yes gene_type:complete
VVKKDSNFYFFIIILNIFLIDFFSKYFLLNFFDLENKGRYFVTRFIDLVLVYNPGISFGIFGNGGEVQRIFLIALSVLIISYLIFWIKNSTSKILSYGLCLIIAGALGNMFDRIIYGKVVDFISLHVFDYYWYVFNIADLAIVFGGLSILMVSVKDSFRSS